VEIQRESSSGRLQPTPGRRQHRVPLVARGWPIAKVSSMSDAGNLIEHARLGDGIWTQEGGVLLAKAAVAALAAVVARKGALLRPRTEVRTVDPRQGTGMTRTGDGALRAIEEAS
jgi:phytoene dehydrogenase-like protein